MTLPWNTTSKGSGTCGWTEPRLTRWVRGDLCLESDPMWPRRGITSHGWSLAAGRFFTVSCEGSEVWTHHCLSRAHEGQDTHTAVHLSALDQGRGVTEGEERSSWCHPQGSKPLPPSLTTDMCSCVSCRAITGKFSAPSFLGPWLALLPKRQ